MTELDLLSSSYAASITTVQNKWNDPNTFKYIKKASVIEKVMLPAYHDLIGKVENIKKHNSSDNEIVHASDAIISMAKSDINKLK